MLGIKLPVLCVAILSLAGYIHSAPFSGLNSNQSRELRARVSRILELSFPGGLTTVSNEEEAGAVINGLDNEIKALEEETHVRLNSIDITPYTDEANRQLQLAGVTDPLVARTTLKINQMVAIKFHNRAKNNPPTTDEIVGEVTHALDREIARLENKH